MSDDDYSAWDAPPPPPGLADAVIERMREPAAAAALDPTPARSSRRWIAAGAIAAAAGVVAVAMVSRGEDPAAPSSGFVAAAKPSHVALGASAVELDANSELRWNRDGKVVTATQARGIAMWRVAAEDTIVIDAGAAVASVEATGASLRVEVQMNLSDTRLIGVSAGTAAAVALVTVIVYEGHVNVRSAGQTVHVAAGETVEVRPGEPAVAPPVIASADEIDRLRVERDRLLAEEAKLRAEGDRVAEQRAELMRLEAELRLAKLRMATLTEDDDEVSVTPTLSAGAVSRHLQRIDGKLKACGEHSGTLALRLEIDADGTVASAGVEPQVPIAACVRDVIRATKFPAARTSTTITHTLTLASNLPDQIDKHAIRTAIAAARADIDACDDGSFTGTLKAKVKVHPDGSVTVNDIAPGGSTTATCLRGVLARLAFGATKTGGSFSYPFVFKGKPSKAACDAHTARGNDAANQGDDALALSHYEAALACGDHNVTMRAFLAACKSHNAAKATELYPQLSNRSIVKRCLDFGIDPRGSPANHGVLRVNSEPWSHVIIDEDPKTKRETPAKFDLAPGKHKVTFLVGADKYTFIANIEAGKVTTVTKSFE